MGDLERAAGRRAGLAREIRRVDAILAHNEPASSTERAWRRKNLRYVIDKLDRRLANSMARIAQPNASDERRWAAMRAEISRLRAAAAILEADHSLAYPPGGSDAAA
jgi:hypothetical protein